MTKKNHKKIIKNQEIQEIHGYHSVKAALKNPKRKHKRLFILEKFRNLLKINTKNIEKVDVLTNKEMLKLFGGDNVTQGIVLQTSKLQSKNIKEVINELKSEDHSIIIALDRVTDPQNIGSIMRSCALFNCNTLIVVKDHVPSMTPSLSKSASGAVEIVNYIQVTNLKRTLEDLKDVGYWVYGLDSSVNTNIKQINLPKKCVLVLGSESSGIRDLNKKVCDELFSLTYKPINFYEIDSLNVSNACSIALYEYYKKYNNK